MEVHNCYEKKTGLKERNKGEVGLHLDHSTLGKPGVGGSIIIIIAFCVL